MRVLAIMAVLMFAAAAPAQAALITVQETTVQTQTSTFSNPVFTFSLGNLPAQSRGVGLAWGLSKTWQTQWQWQWQGQSQKQQAAPVPTPGAAALLLAGLFGVAAMRTRKMLTVRS